MIKKHFIIALIMLLAALSRLIPHPPNFTPLIAIALFSGFYVADKVLIYGLPIAIMLISDLFLGFYSISIFVYLSFLLISFFGTLSKNPGAIKIVSAVLLGSVSFFIITNFGVWVLGGYPRNLAGLLRCYIVAIPFFKNTLMGSFFYSTIMILCYLFCREIYKLFRTFKMF